MKSTKKGIKKILKLKVGQARRKGSILVEFVVAIPVLFVLIWGILNLMTYLLSSSHLNEAAYETARSIAKELRGYEGTDIQSKVQFDTIKKEMELIIRQNQFLSYGLKGHTPEEAYTKSDCNKLLSPSHGIMKDNKDVFCAYIEPYSVGTGKSHSEVVVKIRSSFQVIGAAVQNMEDLVQVNASSTAPQELPDRLNYMTYN
jgi:hypothetical protein